MTETLIDAIGPSAQIRRPVINGGCPWMFCPTSDGGHKMIRLVCTPTGRCLGRCDSAVGVELSEVSCRR